MCIFHVIPNARTDIVMSSNEIDTDLQGDTGTERELKPKKNSFLLIIWLQYVSMSSITRCVIYE